MTASLFSILAGLILLYGGATLLVRGAVGLSLRAGIPALTIGLTVVAFGTSAPELSVSVLAAAADRGGMAAGNVIGSNICNVLLILGLAAMIRPLKVHADVVRREIPVMLGATFLLLLFLIDGRLGRIEGAVLAGGLALYLALLLRDVRRKGGPAAPEAEAALPRLSAGGGVRDVLMLLAGLAVLVGGAHLLVRGAVHAAALLGVPEGVVALTLVAIGTSLPELATSAVASLRGESDIAVGNVVGSNTFNLLCILGIAALVRPLTTAGIGWVDLGVMSAAAVLLLPLCRTGFTVSRAEGALLLTGYVGYVIWLVLTAG